MAGMPKRQRTDKIIRILQKAYPDAQIALRYGNPLELLVAVMLSAQCTDKRVNIVTADLFKKYRSLRDYAHASPARFEQTIRSAGFFRNKTKNIIAAARLIECEFEGEVPRTMEELLRLPGVARKTANIVLFNAFGKQEGIAVDTHVARLSQRLGLSPRNNPEKIETDLMSVVPSKIWGRFSYLLIEHGRAVCSARKPRCGDCPVSQLCDYYTAERG